MPQPILGFGLSRTASLHHHLQHNHYPPIDLRWVPIAEVAIELAVGAAEVITYENDEGLYFNDPSVLDAEVGQGKTAAEVLDGLHLWGFVEYAVSATQAALQGEYEPKAGE